MYQPVFGKHAGKRYDYRHFWQAITCIMKLSEVRKEAGDAGKQSELLATSQILVARLAHVDSQSYQYSGHFRLPVPNVMSSSCSSYPHAATPHFAAIAAAQGSNSNHLKNTTIHCSRSTFTFTMSRKSPCTWKPSTSTGRMDRNLHEASLGWE